MQKNKVKEILRAGKCAYGTSLEDALGSEMPLILAKAGLDFFFVDTEHSPADYFQLQALCRTAHYSGITPLLRVTQNRPELITRALDNGAMGVESLAGPAQFWNPPTARHNDGAMFSFLDGHCELWRWRGTVLVTLNRQKNADDSLTQRGSPSTNPLNPTTTTATDPDYLRLANALPEP